MAEKVEEVLKVEPEVKKEEVKSEPELSETEKKAISMGWRPKDQWNGPDEEFTDAGEFIRRQPLFDRIEYQNKKLKNVEQALNQLTEHHSKVREQEYVRALKELKDLRKEAVKQGENEYALEMEEKIEELQTEYKKLPPIVANPPVTNEPTQEFQEWIKTNSWYMKDTEMHNDADDFADVYIKRSQREGKQINERDIFTHVNEKMRKAHPEKFENPARARPSAVSSGDQSGKPARNSFKLSPEQEEVAKSFERNGIMTRDKYIAEVKRLEGVE